MSKYPVGPGWWPLLGEMEQKIRALDPEIQLMYKEKYGTVQVDYITESSEYFNEINRLTMEVEKASETICEFCGRPGKLGEQHGWLLTTCDRCAALDSLERRKIEQETEREYYRSRVEDLTDEDVLERLRAGHASVLAGRTKDARKAISELRTKLMKDMVRNVTGTMALSGFVLTEEDKERLRLAADPEQIETIVEELVAKHKRPQQTLEERLTDFYGKPVEEIGRIEGDKEFWDED